MGWFGGSSTKDKDEGAPNREDRKKCWEARDGYFSCLDNAGVIKAGDEGKACAKESKEYEKNCAKSWIDYFNQRRIIAEAQKERLARQSQK